MRQASRAVPTGYRQGVRSAIPEDVLTPDADVLDAQNAIPEDGRPVRTRPSIPNYQSREERQAAQAAQVAPVANEASYEFVEAESVEEAPTKPAHAAKVGKHAAVRDAADAVLDSAEKTEEPGPTLLDNLQQSDVAAKAKDIASGIPGVLASVGSLIGRIYRTKEGVLRPKAIIITLVAVLYLALSIWFSFHYYPFTNIGQAQVGGMTTQQASKAIGEVVEGYSLQVEGENGVSFTVMSSEAGLALDADQLAQQAMDADSGFLWPVFVLLPHDHSDVMLASANTTEFREVISDAVAYYNEDAVAPTDATIQYNAPERKFEVIPENRGNTLNEEKIVEHVQEALASMQPVLTLGEDDYLQPSVFQDDERLQASLAKAQNVLSTSITFSAHGRDVSTLDGATAASWVYTDEDVNLVLDEDQVNEWVQKLVDKCGTVGNKRTWTREDGVTCSVQGGDYGWEADWLAVDEALHEYIYSGSAQKVEVPMQQEAAVYTGPNERDWKSYIDVDLDAQHATYYDDNGKVLWEADFVSGIPDGKHDTPQGVYYVNNKQSPAELVGDAGPTGDPEYRTKVEYWICWRGSDVGFHDADWQEAFGGTLYMDGNGSHGCINLSHEDVAALYKIVDIDTVVVSHGANQPTVESKSSEDEEDEE